METIGSIAGDHGIAVIEDAAAPIGSECRGRGLFGHAGVSGQDPDHWRRQDAGGGHWTPRPTAGFLAGEVAFKYSLLRRICGRLVLGGFNLGLASVFVVVEAVGRWCVVHMSIA
jgi:hypothetical protein